MSQDEEPRDGWVACVITRIPTLDREPALAEIARSTLRMATLEPRNMHMLDVYQVPVWFAREALTQAYERGRTAGAIETTLVAERDTALEAAVELQPLLDAPTGADVVLVPIDGGWEARLRDRSARGTTAVAALRELRLEYERRLGEHLRRPGAKRRFVAVCIPGDEEKRVQACWFVMDREGREPEQRVSDMHTALRLERKLNEDDAR